jgi:hypothetical protein
MRLNFFCRLRIFAFADQNQKCSWGLENDDARPPTKQLVESLRVKVRVLEHEIARLQAENQNKDQQTIEGSPPEASFDGSSSSNALDPNQFREVCCPRLKFYSLLTTVPGHCQ